MPNGSRCRTALAYGLAPGTVAHVAALSEASNGSPRAGLGSRLRQLLRRSRRTWLRSDGFLLLALCGLCLLLASATTTDQQWLPPSMLALIVLVGGFVLSVRSLVLLIVVASAALAYEIAELGTDRVRPGNVLVVAGTAIVVLFVARSRARLGVQGLRGESMLVDLRDRLRAQGELPALPQGWSAEVVLRSAGGASFGGDFVVVSSTPNRNRLELALVDVSGKGLDAGTRALVLSGSFGGLLGAMRPPEFLPAANNYLLRQQWDDGFATAVQVALDLETGAFFVGSAGHPPAAHFEAGSGRWRLLDAQAVAVGVAEQGGSGRERGALRPGH